MEGLISPYYMHSIRLAFGYKVLVTERLEKDEQLFEWSFLLFFFMQSTN